MNPNYFTGTGTALATPFSGGEVDYAALGRLIDFQIEGGVGALIACGTTGEVSTLSEAEREGVIRFAVERAAGRLPVIAGTGSNDTAACARRCARARESGADGVLIVTPYYNKTTQAGLIAHYERAAEAGGLPAILYNVPSRTGLNALPETVARIAEHPLVRGVKEASGDISQIAEILRLFGDRVALFSGNDDQVLPILALGGQGVISTVSNVAPAAMARLTSRWFAGDVSGAREAQFRLNPLVKRLFAEVNPIPLKAALELMGIAGGELRLPLVPISEANREALKAEMEAFGLIGG